MRLSLFLVLAFGTACGDATTTDPPSNSGGTGSTGGNPSTGGNTTASIGADTYFPLIDGATWTYQHSRAVGADLVPESIEQETQVACSTDPGRCSAWTDYDPDSDGFWQGPPVRTGERTEGILIANGDLVMRVHKWEYGALGELELEADYMPGFPRFDNSWPERDAQFEQAYTYERKSTVEAMSEERVQTYRVEALSETIEVPAGTFDCIKIFRERMEDVSPGATDQASQKMFWFAKGIGKIREEHLDGETKGNVEELLTCSLCP